MSHANWATPQTQRGSGPSDNTWQFSAHTGRSARTTYANITAATCEPVVQTLIQAGATEFVNGDDTGSVAKTGGNLTIHGVSNSKKLTFSLANNNIGLVLPANYTAGGVQTVNGAEIAGDPGASAQYEFSIAFSNVAANEGVSARTTQLIITDDAGHTDTCLITQAAGDAYLEVTPLTIETDAAGTPKSFHIDSNTTWEIS